MYCLNKTIYVPTYISCKIEKRLYDQFVMNQTFMLRRKYTVLYYDDAGTRVARPKGYASRDFGINELDARFGAEKLNK